MLETFKDVFIIHSKREPLEDALASHLSDWLTQVGISVYEYSDWQWLRVEPGKFRYRSAGSNLDPIRYAMGHPEPFRKKTKEQIPDRHTLGEMLGNCRVVVFIAPRGGSISAGVDVERDVLRREPAVVLATWGEQNDWLVRERRHGYLYQITRTFDPRQEKAALDLANIVWLVWMFDGLVHECQSAGRKLLVELEQWDQNIQKIIRYSGRLSTSLGKSLDKGLSSSSSGLELKLESLAEALSVPEVRTVLRYWWERSNVQALLPPSSNQDVASLVHQTVTAIDHFCDIALRRHPEVIDDKAEALRLRAAHMNAMGKFDLAMQGLNNALELPGLSPTGRSRLLADRAAMAMRSSPGKAERDVEEILTLPESSRASTAQALWLRARMRIRGRNTTAALDDLSAALNVPEIAPALRALCFHDRATIRARLGDSQAALKDLDEAMRIQGLPADITGPAQLDRAVLLGQFCDVEGELADYSEVIDLKNVPDETRLKAHMYRGLTRMERGDRLGAVKDFVVVRDDEASPPEAKRAATENLEKL